MSRLSKARDAAVRLTGERVHKWFVFLRKEDKHDTHVIMTAPISGDYGSLVAEVFSVGEGETLTDALNAVFIARDLLARVDQAFVQPEFAEAHRVLERAARQLEKKFRP